MVELGKVKGIPVRIGTDYMLATFILTMLAYLGGGSMPMFNMFLAILAISIVVILHEFGHALTARSFGIRTESITLHAIGGIAALNPTEYKKSIAKPVRSLLIWLAGPGVNLVLYGLTTLLIWILFGVGAVAHSTLFRYLSFFQFINLILALFNLLPIFPLDGGGILYSILAMITSRKRAILITSRVGMLGAICLIIWALSIKAPITAFIGIMAFFISKSAPKDTVFSEG